jgi:hypothetical protein
LIGENTQVSILTFLITAVCCIIALYQYRYCRRYAPPEHSRAFEQFDKNDMSALFPLFSGLITGFFMSMEIAQYFLNHYYQGDLNTAALGTQSILINSCAILLIFLALAKHNKELRNVALLIMIIGGGKVFILDLFRIKGTWLVAGILAFGIAAALQSLVLARWKTETDDMPQRLATEVDKIQAELDS